MNAFSALKDITSFEALWRFIIAGPKKCKANNFRSVLSYAGLDIHVFYVKRNIFGCSCWYSSEPEIQAACSSISKIHENQEGQRQEFHSMLRPKQLDYL